MGPRYLLVRNIRQKSRDSMRRLPRLSTNRQPRVGCPLIVQPSARPVMGARRCREIGAFTDRLRPERQFFLSAPDPSSIVSFDTTIAKSTKQDSQRAILHTIPTA